MHSKQRLILILTITGTILLIPLIAMQFTNEVNWNWMDFVVAAVLLLGTGLLFELATRKVHQIKYKVAIGLVVLLALLFIWAELAVGIVGTPFSGS